MADWEYHGERVSAELDGYEHRWSTKDPLGMWIVFRVVAGEKGMTQGDVLAWEERRRRREGETAWTETGDCIE